jgi:hypothetical protein
LLEWARVLRGTHGYGTPRAPVEAALAAGEDMVFDIDWQGFRLLRDRLPGDVVGVFILPPGLAVLEQRLRARGAESDAGDRSADADGAGGNLALAGVRLRRRERPPGSGGRGRDRDSAGGPTEGRDGRLDWRGL